MAELYATPHGEGHPVLVLHGGGLDHRHMLDAVEPVFEHRSGFQRVYVDLPGHGRSHGPDIRSQDDVVAAVRSFCDDRFDTPFAVVGESRGSLIARAPNQHDGRSHLLELTAEGLSIHEEVMPLALATERELFKGFDAVEQEQFRALLGRLREQAAALSRPSKD